MPRVAVGPCACGCARPASARAGRSIRISASIRGLHPAARGAALVVRPSAPGGQTARRTTAIPGATTSVRLATDLRLPRGAKVGRRVRFQVVIATFATRDAARAATDLTGACDAGAATFSVRVKR